MYVQKHCFHYLGLATPGPVAFGPLTPGVIRARVIPLGMWS